MTASAKERMSSSRTCSTPTGCGQSSPLLAFYILWILRQRLNSIREGEGVEARHWPVSDLCLLFEGCGVADELTMQVLNRLYERRLIEALDPNVNKIGVGDKVAIKESGIAHIELILTSNIYIEQTALTSGINELFTRDEMRRNNHSRKMDEAREAFLRYVLKVDAGRIAISASAVYGQLRIARKQLERMTSQGKRRMRAAE